MGGMRPSAELQSALRAGLERQAAGALDEAAAAYARALAILPGCADALHLLGQVRHRQGRDDAALDLVGRAIKAAPAPTAMYENTRGAILRALGQGQAALAAFRRAVAIDPRHAGARKNLAVELARAEAACDELVEAFLLAASLQPQDPECWLGLARALAQAGRGADAMIAAERAAAGDPACGDAFDVWFAAARLAGRLDAFVDAMQALAARGAGPLARGLRHVDGLLALARGDAALAVARALVTAYPDEPAALEKLAVAEQALGAFDAAAVSFARALERDGDREFAAIGLAQCTMDAGRLDAAEDLYARAVARFPAAAQAWNGRGVVLGRLDRDAEAVRCFDRALELSPDGPMVLSNRAISLLRLGRLGAAWSDYRWRETSPGPVPRTRWPSDLAGRHIHVMAEQGIGDHLFFLRFVPAIRARGASVTTDADARLAGMLGRAGIAVVAGPPPAAEVVAMGDLPWLLGCGDDDMPPPVGLPALPAQAAAIAALLARLPRPVICATWRAGGRKGRTDTVKLVPPEALGAALRALPGTVVSVQRHPQPGEHAAFVAGLGRDAPDLGALNDDLEAMLALMTVADAYAGVSNANLHLRCGAGMGADILATVPIDWRWRAGEDGGLPWYPGCVAYRQDPEGRWNVALARLGATLGARLG
jgi:tetratricopeptide (TPR) repeat protein